MKTLKNLLIALSLLTPSIMFSQKMVACEQQRHCIKPTFRVNLNSTDCFYSGKTVQANVQSTFSNRQPFYTFLWEVDGTPFGHAPLIECVNGRVATVYVTEYPTGLRVSKSINLTYVPDK